MHLRVAICLLLAIRLSAYAADAAPDNPAPAASEIERSRQLDNFMVAAAGSLKIDQLDALLKIDDDDKRYLAMTYYLRAGSSLASRWSWTSDRIKAYEKSREYSAARAEIKTISACFSMLNPEHVLHVNPQVRSLEDQVVRWQAASSAGEAARELRKAALATLTQKQYEQEPNDVSLKRFLGFLNSWHASRLPTVVAPGLSLHGRGRAFDFQIRDKNGHTVADTETSAISPIWEYEGWTGKLSQAVHESSSNFVGPLQKPYEPWHYEYKPGR